MPDEHDIRIIQWPKQKALLEHYFKLDDPCPVSIHFDAQPAHVKVGNEKGERFDVDMNMNLKVTEDIPVCIKICEPICAVSDYSVGIELLGQPLARIRVKGKTKLGPCEDTTPVRVCTDFRRMNPKKDLQVPLTVEGLQFTPLNGATTQTYTTMGEPNGQLKLLMPNQGMRIDFPSEVNQVELTIVNFGNSVIQINGFLQGNLVSEQTEIIENTTMTVLVSGSSVTAVEIKGGSNEAALSQVCYQRPTGKRKSNTININ